MEFQGSIRRAIEYVSPRTVLDGKDVERQLEEKGLVDLPAGTKATVTVFLEDGARHLRTTTERDHQVGLVHVFPTPYDNNYALFEPSSPELAETEQTLDEIADEIRHEADVELVPPEEIDPILIEEYATVSAEADDLFREAVTEFLFAEPDVARRVDLLSVRHVFLRTGITKSYPTEE